MTYLPHALIALAAVLAVGFVYLLVKFARSQPYGPDEDDD